MLQLLGGGALSKGYFLLLCHPIPEIPRLLAQLVLLTLARRCAAMNVRRAEYDKRVTGMGDVARFAAATVTFTKGGINVKKNRHRRVRSCRVQNCCQR